MRPHAHSGTPGNDAKRTHPRHEVGVIVLAHRRTATTYGRS
jgi:hypothetical protein